jgi:prolyl-tRNA editing enzyme YbaK/EbsC (Cys-tRNA(Pro) deacylase)
VLTITCGPAYVERRALASLYGVGRKKVKLASPETVLQETGYPVGGMPPFGHRQPVTTLIDHRVLENPEVYAGGGQIPLIRLSPLTIVQAAQVQVLDLLTPPDPGFADNRD